MIQSFSTVVISCLIHCKTSVQWFGIPFDKPFKFMDLLLKLDLRDCISSSHRHLKQHASSYVPPRIFFNCCFRFECPGKTKTHVREDLSRAGPLLNLQSCYIPDVDNSVLHYLCSSYITSADTNLILKLHSSQQTPTIYPTRMFIILRSTV